MGFFEDAFGFIMGKDEIDKEYDNCVKTCKATKDAARAAKKANAAAPVVQAEGAPATEGGPAQSGGRRRRKINTKKGGKKANKVKSTVKKCKK